MLDYIGPVECTIICVVYTALSEVIMSTKHITYYFSSPCSTSKGHIPSINKMMQTLLGVLVLLSLSVGTSIAQLQIVCEYFFQYCKVYISLYVCAYLIKFTCVCVVHWRYYVCLYKCCYTLFLPSAVSLAFTINESIIFYINA